MVAKSFLSSLLASQALAAAHGRNYNDGGQVPSPSSVAPSGMPTTYPDANKPGACAPTAAIDCGTVVGTTTYLPAATAAVNKFLGVPFAQPPKRFSPPQKGGPGSCNIDAKAWKPACIQQFVYPKIRQDFVKSVFNNPTPEESEDCLYLNVYAPSSPPPPGGRAVMFWIYGGALQFGNAGQPSYDGSSFAAYEDVIVVTSNYRTNVFGFATSPEIPLAEQNLGFLDQRAGLDWVQRNIAAFGGSPEKVTIFGESAGGFSVDALLTSFPKNSTPPFRGAILESGQFSYNAQPRTSTVPLWNQLAALLNCTTTHSQSSNLTCLRDAPANAIKNAIEVSMLAFNPVADGITLVANPMQQRLSGKIAHIPILGGSNAQEGRVFTVGQTNSTTFLSQTLGTNASAIKTLEAAYPPYQASNGSEAYDQVSEIFTEFVFQCPAAYHADATASIGIPAWRYYFNASFANTQAYPNLGVYHASEIPIVFSTYPKVNVTSQEYALSTAMRGAWARFAKNPVGGPGWNPVRSGKAGSVLVGAMSEAPGGIVQNGDAPEYGGYYVGVLGNRGNALSSGVTIVDSNEIDYRCGLYVPAYDSFANFAAPS